MYLSKIPIQIGKYKTSIITHFNGFAFKKVSFLYLGNSLRWSKALLMIKPPSINTVLGELHFFLHSPLYGNYTLPGCQGQW